MGSLNTNGLGRRLIMIEKRSKQTTVRISGETRHALAKFGNKNDTFNDIIWRLMEKVKGIEKV